jgi:hypothetical protein
MYLQNLRRTGTACPIPSVAAHDAQQDRSGDDFLEQEGQDRCSHTAQAVRTETNICWPQQLGMSMNSQELIQWTRTCRQTMQIHLYDVRFVIGAEE